MTETRAGDGPVLVSGEFARVLERGAAWEAACLVHGRIAGLGALADELGVTPDRALAVAHRRWGSAMLSRLRGEFALLIWDPSVGRGLVARDQLGGGAIYLRDTGRRLVVASEVRGLLGLLRTRPAPDRVSLVDWIAGGPGGRGRCLYDGVDALGAGDALVLEHHRWTPVRYWAPRYTEPAVRGAELVDALRCRSTTAVERCSEPGESTAVLLSGGLDSTTVAGIAARRVEPARRVARAYSAVFPAYPSMDEAPLIDAVIAHLALPSVRMAGREGSMLAGALAHPGVWELPLRAANLYFWLPLLRRAAADGMAATLDGEGGDLLFGAVRELMADRLRQGRPVAAVGLARRLPGAGNRPPWPIVLRLVAEHGVRAALGPGAERAARRLDGSGPAPPAWLRAADARMLREHREAATWKRLDGPRWWARLVDGLTDGLDGVGVRESIRHRAALAGVRAHSPLLDVDLVQAVLDAPPEAAFHPRLSRPLLRALADGAVPEPVRLRAGKSYFDELVQRSIAGVDRGPIDALLGARDAEIASYVDAARLQHELRRGPAGHPGGGRGWVRSVWRLAAAECWLRHQADPGFAERFSLRAGVRAATTLST